MCSMEIIVNNTILYTWKLLRVDLKCSHHTKIEMINVSTNPIVVILLQNLNVSNDHLVHLKLTQRYMSIMSQ